MLKIILTVIFSLIMLIAALLFLNTHRQLLSKNYPQKIQTGGEIERTYSLYGPFEVSYFEQKVPQNYKKYEIWYPADMPVENKTYPVIVINNGTGMHASRCKAAYTRLASWGFIVIANEEEYSWNGFAADMSIQYLLRANQQQDSIFYHHVDTENIGVTGHSQGGVACINTVTETKHAGIYKAAFLVSPAVEELAAGLEWDYDISKVTIPCAIISGTGNTDAKIITPLDGMFKMYEHATASPLVIIARKTGYDHNYTSMQTDGYMTAWFMWLLKNDTTAALAFTGNNPEILENPLYQDQLIK
ncbi:MAG: hypothetical protein ACI4EV_07690 [Lachnospiraceae bacterium]